MKVNTAINIISLVIQLILIWTLAPFIAQKLGIDNGIRVFSCTLISFLAFLNTKA